MAKVDESAVVGKAAHNVTLTGREKVSLSGVEDVASFDEHSICVNTSLGRLLIAGQNLHMETLDLTTGLLNVAGAIASIEYQEPANRAAQSRGLKRIFK